MASQYEVLNPTSNIFDQVMNVQRDIKYTYFQIYR